MASIVVVGSIGIDTIETPEDRAEDVLGGSASHFSVAASFYTDVSMIGVVGTDFPEEHRKILVDRGVDLEAVEVREGKTFRWTGRYHENHDRRTTLDTQLNVFADYTPTIPEALESPEILFLGNIHPALQLDVLDKVKSCGLVAADSMELWIDTCNPQIRELLERIDLLFINEDEAQMLSGEHSLVDAGRKLLTWGPKRVALKKGSHGAILFEGSDEIFFVPAYPWTQVVDPTGAGDSFAGGYLGYLAKHGLSDADSHRKALVHGSVMGSVNVADFSCNAFVDLPPETIEERYGRFQEITRF